MRLIRQAFFVFLAYLALAFVHVNIAKAAPYAAIVVDARDGSVIYSRNGNQTLHPASLTKMMTLYIAFSEVEAGRMRLDQQIPISRNAASEPPSKIGLRAGSSMELRYLLRAAAIKSANDASTAIAEAIAGSEDNFANYMTKVARALGMKNTKFQNAHGLTQNGHYSTAYDMAILGRHLVYDFPSYYGLFKREYAATPLGNFRNSNIRFLRDYPGADGIKTGYTRAAGYNLVGSAKRGKTRIIVSMFGGQSSYQRNEQIGALLDLGFRKARKNVRVSNISRLNLKGPTKAAPKPTKIAKAPAPKPKKTTSKPRKSYAPSQAVIPPSRALAAPVAAIAAATDTTVSSIVADIIATPPTRPAAQAAASSASPTPASTGTPQWPASFDIPAARPGTLVAHSNTSPAAPVAEGAKEDIVEESSSDDYAIQLGAKPSKIEAESYLIATSLAEEDSLGEAKNQVVSVELNGAKMYRPRFSGVSKNAAYNACSRIQARNEQCYVIAPDQG